MLSVSGRNSPPHGNGLPLHVPRNLEPKSAFLSRRFSALLHRAGGQSMRARLNTRTRASLEGALYRDLHLTHAIQLKRCDNHRKNNVNRTILARKNRYVKINLT